MSAAPSAGPLTSLSDEIQWKLPSGCRRALPIPSYHREGGDQLYFLNLFQGKR